MVYTSSGEYGSEAYASGGEDDSDEDGGLGGGESADTGSTSPSVGGDYESSDSSNTSDDTDDWEPVDPYNGFDRGSSSDEGGDDGFTTTDTTPDQSIPQSSVTSSQQQEGLADGESTTHVGFTITRDASNISTNEYVVSRMGERVGRYRSLSYAKGVAEAVDPSEYTPDDVATEQTSPLVETPGGTSQPPTGPAGQSDASSGPGGQSAPVNAGPEATMDRARALEAALPIGLLSLGATILAFVIGRMGGD